MSKAPSLNIISSNTFARLQKHCAAPVIKEMRNKMNSIVVGILEKYGDLCLCGAGRNDSPGHSARYCVYTLMENSTKVVLDMAVVDKRETGGNSVAIEKEGLRWFLEKMVNILPISELTTDASSTITKLVGEMNGMMILLYPCILLTWSLRFSICAFVKGYLNLFHDSINHNHMLCIIKLFQSLWVFVVNIIKCMYICIQVTC